MSREPVRQISNAGFILMAGLLISLSTMALADPLEPPEKPLLTLEALAEKLGDLRPAPSSETKAVPGQHPSNDLIAKATSQLINISTNGSIDALPMIAGFIILGNSPLRVAIMGEDLDTEIDPLVLVTDLAVEIVYGFNDDWFTLPAEEQQELAERLRVPNRNTDAALVLTLEPGVYLASLFDYYNLLQEDNWVGRVVLAVNAIGGTDDSRLLNISTNGRIDAAGMIAGFIVTGPGDKRFAIMGENMQGMVNPAVRVTNLEGTIEFGGNDNWQNHPTAQELVDKLRAPFDVNDAGLVLSLSPGVYLAHLIDTQPQLPVSDGPRPEIPEPTEPPPPPGIPGIPGGGKSLPRADVTPFGLISVTEVDF